MTLVKSFSVGNGDMYYIRHGSDNFSIIDCCIPQDRRAEILPEISTQLRDRDVVRFISTHPDQDHISGLVELDDRMSLRNFYCVQNAATKNRPTADFERYCALRDSEKAYYLYAGCKRKWMNVSSDRRRSAGLSCLWPITGNEHHVGALADAAEGLEPNNISCILKYSRANGVTMMWMGDLETDYMEKIENHIEMPEVDVLFAPHHGRASGKVPQKWLAELDPKLVIIGNAPSEYLDYYSSYAIITQNSAGDLLFDCVDHKVHIYAGDHTYNADCLDDEGLDSSHGLYYVGTLQTRD